MSFSEEEIDNAILWVEQYFPDDYNKLELIAMRAKNKLPGSIVCDD